MYLNINSKNIKILKFEKLEILWNGHNITLKNSILWLSLIISDNNNYCYKYVIFRKLPTTIRPTVRQCAKCEHILFRKTATKSSI